ncbi:hypothetical protein FEDK69T_31020 [Flavobacterium enshiense DK69]|uniref:Uncharacterized protein n=1 Tax=Flavobacterium enshiense DK69 TaxID=1107311 RepID=V6RZE4_9FLAO|nr:hypothetical protein [Flavobacterium enshiense]ESU19841.1 hypothetical protein FEDK69T_30970 [Flavobacterium enshiense DK69]ESU19846.1 hypothetical protein FEDK69T_31020 [Flavobacterium enshiense DK69]KGO91276.1 hypothetical protein Q767_15970 [Flavobacterium enshiense DK69]
MIEIFWGILNIAILIYFTIICFKSVKLIKEKIGILAALVFALGILSFASKPNDKYLADKNIDFLNQTNPKMAFNGNSFFQEVKLEDNLSTKIRLSILVGEKGNELIILNANCSKEGFISGTNWNVQNIDVDKPKDKNYCNYSVSGFMEWKILGITFYSERKTFKGNAILKK